MIHSHVKNPRLSINWTEECGQDTFQGTVAIQGRITVALCSFAWFALSIGGQGYGPNVYRLFYSGTADRSAVSDCCHLALHD